uniref:Uncharacterized protein n=1 Tax=Avena sativa TaxID=4498 RepID=A0ACD5TBR0_AVESA
MDSEMGEMLPAASPLDDIDDNLLSEILLRLSPQPSSLPRASAVCKRWHSLACNPFFCRRFRRHHRRNPPLLGIFDRNKFLSFIPTLDAPDRVPPGRFSLPYGTDRYEPCGFRHGLVVIIDLREREDYLHILVWDPITGDQKHIYAPSEYKDGTIFRGAVLRDDREVHFRVVLAGSNKEDERVLARVYSSQTGLWSNLVSIPLPPGALIISDEHALCWLGIPFIGSFREALLEFSSLTWKV